MITQAAQAVKQRLSRGFRLEDSALRPAGVDGDCFGRHSDVMDLASKLAVQSTRSAALPKASRIHILLGFRGVNSSFFFSPYPVDPVNPVKQSSLLG